MRLVLASASARRRELLTAAGVPFIVDPADIDEGRHTSEPPHDYARRVAVAKARLVSARHPPDIVLGADTIVLVDGVVLGKPANADDAADMLSRLSGRAHDVLTGVAIESRAGSGSFVETTRVWFTDLDAGQIRWYVASGEPMDKAGAYAIQGLASRFVTRIEGSYSNVVGLPVAAVLQFLRENGLDAHETPAKTVEQDGVRS
jgi:septum formation protein